MKLGGDKGGGTFKMCFQHLNVPSPNAPENTCVFSIFEAPDSYTNLQISLSRHSEEIMDLESQTWRYTYTQYYITLTPTIIILEGRK